MGLTMRMMVEKLDVERSRRRFMESGGCTYGCKDCRFERICSTENDSKETDNGKSSEA